MRTIEQTITGTDGTEARFTGYLLDNSPEIDMKRTRPAVLVIPGGGYEMTSDREAEPIAMKMLGYGFHAFVLRYSVAPSRYPVALVELAEAMRTIRTNAKDWNIDPHAVVVAGFSAGGHLAADLATEYDGEELKAHGYTAGEVRPDGCMLGYSVIDSGKWAHRGSFDALLGERKADRELLDRLCLERHVDAKTPPCFIWHTATDDTVPVQNALLFTEALVEHGVQVETHIFPKGGHGLSLGTAETAGTTAANVVPCIQIWPDLFNAWMRRNFTH